MSNENKELAIQKDISDKVLARIKEKTEAKELNLPPNYSAGNAMKFGWLKILETKNLNKQPALSVCTKDSIANALLEMATQGLNPAKNQCYFIVHGDTLTMMRSYFGTMAVAKRAAGVKEVFAIPIYQGDEFEFKVDFRRGKREITKHEQKFENIDNNKINGAYAVVIYNELDKDGENKTSTEIMTMPEIRKAWEQGPQKGQGKVHTNFTAEMAKKTVIARALKFAINSSDDADLFFGSNPEEIETIDTVAEDVQTEVNAKANQITEGFTEAEITDETPKTNPAPEVDPGF
jgi:recombination protein RecT